MAEKKLFSTKGSNNIRQLNIILLNLNKFNINFLSFTCDRDQLIRHSFCCLLTFNILLCNECKRKRYILMMFRNKVRDTGSKKRAFLSIYQTFLLEYTLKKIILKI